MTPFFNLSKENSVLLIFLYLTDIRSPFSPPYTVPDGFGGLQHSQHSVEPFQFVTLKSGKTTLYQENILSVSQFTKQQVFSVVYILIVCTEFKIEFLVKNS